MYALYDVCGKNCNSKNIIGKSNSITDKDYKHYHCKIHRETGIETCDMLKESQSAIRDICKINFEDNFVGNQE